MSVRVNRAAYTPNMETVAINAIPYLPARKFTAYAIVPGAVDEAILADVRARITEEETLAAQLKIDHASAYTLFERLLFPYPDVIDGAKMPLMEFAVDAIAGKITKGYVSRDPRMNPSQSFVYLYTDAPNDPYAVIRDNIVLEAVVVELLEDYCAHLRTIREYIELYPTDQVKSHVNLWAIYTKNKNTQSA